MTSSALGPRVLLLRHGETTWARQGRHTGRTDIPLTARGEQQARAAATALAGLHPLAVLVSPLQRATRTAQLAGLAPYETDPDLQEWDYGEVEGITTAEWQVRQPGWSVWDPGPPGGETLAGVGARADRVLARIHRVLDVARKAGARDLAEDVPDEPPRDPAVVVVAHGHLLRILAARWLGLEPRGGALFRLDPATISELGREHGRPVLLSWNARP